MKNLFIVLVCLLFIGCGNQTYIPNFKEGFIVDKVTEIGGEYKGESNCVYRSKNYYFNEGGGLFRKWPRIYAPCGEYSIGDTIMLAKKKGG